MANFKWAKDAIRAAELVAEDKLSNAEIAAEVGVSRSGLDKWKAHPEFKARVEEHVEEYRVLVRRRGLAQLERRVDALNDRWERMQRVIEARALAYADDAHGGETGLVRRKVAGWQGKGEDKEPVYDYEFDAALLKELREHEKQAAQELGQWTEKVQSEVRATVVNGEKQLAMLGNERAIELACDLEREISRGRDRDSDPGGVRAAGE